MFAIHFDHIHDADHRMTMVELDGTEFRIADGRIYNVYGQWVPIEDTSIAGPLVVDGLLTLDSITIDKGQFIGHTTSNCYTDVPVRLARLSSITALDSPMVPCLTLDGDTLYRTFIAL